MRWDALSGFHLLLLTASAAGLLLFRLTLKLVALRMHRSLAPSPGLSSPPDPDMQQAPSGILISYLILSGLMALLATYLVCFHLVHILTAGSKWILKEDRLLHHVAETAPLSLQTAAENFTGIIFLFPLLIVHMLHRGRKEGRLGSVLLFVVYSLTIGACTLVSERFSDLFSVVAAVLIGYFMSVLFQSATSLFSGHQKSPVFRKSRPSRLLATALCMAIAGCAAWPTARWLASYAKSAPLYSAGDLHEMCLWLRDHTAQSPGYADFSAKPDYSVLATWENGNALTYLARRANVANNFLGWPENREANLKPYRFFVADNLADAESILDECRVRYVVVSEPVISGQFARMLDVLGLDQNEYFVVNAQGLFESQRKMMNTMALRLYLHDGKHMNHFRLVFESTTKRAAAGQLSGIFKIFEYDKWAIRAQGPVPVSSGYSRSILKSPAPANDFRWE
jgi:asparagine N-glycosylation enzyme membrane subunit Stt3